MLGIGRILKRKTGEVYQVAVVSGGLTLTINRAFYDHLLENLSGKENLKKNFLEIRSALYTDKVVFELSLPFILFPNRSHKKPDWKILWKRSEQISLLLELFNYVGLENGGSLFCLSENPQLMAISTGIIRGASFSGCPIELGFHQTAFEVLTDECKDSTVINEAERIILDFYSGMSCQTMKEKESYERDLREYGAPFISIRAMVYAGGIPGFLVPGNCACLGANPDEFKDSLSVYSHNMDSPLQQLSLLAGVVSFWNNFLTPKWQARQPV